MNWILRNYLRCHFAGESVVVFLRKMNSKFTLLPTNSRLRYTIQINNKHFSLRFLIINIENLIFSNDKCTCLRPVILIDFWELFAHDELSATKQLNNFLFLCYLFCISNINILILYLLPKCLQLWQILRRAIHFFLIFFIIILALLWNTI